MNTHLSFAPPEARLTLQRPGVQKENTRTFICSTSMNINLHAIMDSFRFKVHYNRMKMIVRNAENNIADYYGIVIMRLLFVTYRFARVAR